MANIYSNAVPAKSLRVDTRDNADMDKESYDVREEESAIICTTPAILQESGESRRSRVFFSSPEAMNSLNRIPFQQLVRRAKESVTQEKEFRQPPNITVDAKSTETGLTDDDLETLARGIFRFCYGDKTYSMGSLVQQDGKFFLLTAKHNFFQKVFVPTSEPDVQFPVGWPTKLSSFTEGNQPTSEDCKPLDIANSTVQQTKQVYWKFGYDVAMFPISKDSAKVLTGGILGKIGFYEIAPEGQHVYTKGMRVGILVWNIPYTEGDEEAERLPYTEGDEEAERPPQYGREEDISILTGEIICPTANTIEVSYNSYHGCSGAPVLCIDKRNEYQDIFGRVIGVHAGHPSVFKDLKMKENVAFKIVGTQAKRNMYFASQKRR